jgi:D-alanyl-D-alanine carboxypeptidase
MTADGALAQAQKRICERIDELVAAGASPGIQYTFATRDGTWTHAAGLATLRPAHALTTATKLAAYSMSKTITAAAVLKVVAEGKLGLDDAAAHHVEVPYGPGVTVRRLLCHTAGLRNPIPLRWVHPPDRHAEFDERAALRAVVAANGTLAAEPGTRFAYTNLGYWLLGAIVERCTGQSFASYVEHELLAPLGITGAELGYTLDPAATATGHLEKWSWLNLLKRLVIDREYIGGYAGSWLEIRAHYVNGPAFGGLIGTTTAFGTWLRDLLGESRVLPREAQAWLFEQQHLASGAPALMTLGWHMGTLAGARHWYKEGGGGGFHSMMRLYGDAGLASVIIGNATGFRAGKVADELDGVLLGSVFEPRPNRHTRASRPPL